MSGHNCPKTPVELGRSKVRTTASGFRDQSRDKCIDAKAYEAAGQQHQDQSYKPYKSQIRLVIGGKTRTEAEKPQIVAIEFEAVQLSC